MGLVKSAANAWQKRLISSGRDRLSDLAVSRIHQAGIARPALQMANGIAKGNQALAPIFNAKFVNNTCDATKEFGNGGGLINKIKGTLAKKYAAPLGIRPGLSAATISKNITGSKNNIIFESDGLEMLPYKFRFKNKHDLELTKSLTNRHELHEAHSMNNKIKHSSGFIRTTGSSEATGSHDNIAVLARESNDIARLRGYDAAPNVFKRARLASSEALGFNKITGHNYGEYINNKEIKRIENISPNKKTFLDRIKDRQNMLKNEHVIPDLSKKDMIMNKHRDTYIKNKVKNNLVDTFRDFKLDLNLFENNRIS